MADKKKKQAGRRAYLNDFHRDLTGAYIYDGSHFHFAGDGWKQALLRLWALGIVLVVLVQLFQSIGTRLSVKLDKRIRK